ncbi:hypothetical protein [Magnetospirillum aberrantis]|uniref:Uncharacterized protein n=1 Tax=Magnetospirillum aberrantis SpK TaxID=908842 RepID=A0A7C9UYJ3_9PROT|nr:hypothetical protein [Magnetospirillum aberrantis]NFV79851.1 hypothetical protein [Magnetospirillum aberrantis SpK]
MKNDRLDYHNRPIKYGVTTADMEALWQRHFEKAQDRQNASDLNLLRAIALGQALKQAGEG